MRKLIIFLLGGVMLSGCTTASQDRVTTVAHEILATEHAVLGTTKQDYARRLARLNSLIEQAVLRVEAGKFDDTTMAGIAEVFSEVDQVLVDNHYNVFVHTETFWEALTPGVPEKGGGRFMTEKMREHRENHPDAVYFRFDCDTGSMIHLAVFERLRKPVVMVEIPGHNFVRWRIAPDQYVNWDVNRSRSYTDDEYRDGSPGVASAFDRETEEARHYLQDMHRTEVIAYHQWVAGNQLDLRGRFEPAVTYFQRAIAGRPHASGPRNSLAWMIATRAVLQRPELLDLAVDMARTAVELSPDDNNIIDTLAAVHAARGEFDEAIATERTGANDPDRIKAYEQRKTPVEMKWGRRVTGR